MKPSRKEQLDKLERALIRTHAARPIPSLSGRGVDAVMREVRRRSSAGAAELVHVVWRAALVVAVASVVLIGSMLTWNAGLKDGELSVALSEAIVGANLVEGEP
jgi:hypothetical protein